MALEPRTRHELTKQARLWSLSLVCATVGAIVVWRTNALLPGIGAFLVTLAVLGPLLYVYERRRGS
ncbi:MAG TPA: hypothetical protein VFU98_05485 [Microlunatus sp.]|nr:hypothetical protein [Microlunatus sp.]